MSKGSPDYPNPTDVAQAEADANRISQYGPSGSLIFGNVGTDGKFNQSTGGAAAMTIETPFQQQFRTGREGLANTLMGQIAPNASNLPTANYAGLPAFQSQLDWSKIAGVPNPEEFGDTARQAQQGVYDKGMSLMRPDLDQARRRLETSLSSKGLPMGSEAYAGEMDRFARSESEAMNRLSLDSIMAGNQEAQRMFGNTMASRGAQMGDQLQQMQLTNAARQTGFGERQAERTNKIQELAALLGGTYNPTPGTQFIAPGQIDVAGIQNAAYGAAANQSNQANQNWAAAFQGASNLAPLLWL